MSQRNKPVLQQEFGGVYTTGDTLKRPPGSSVVCKNFRVMPGKYLRLRGGRTLIIDAGSGTFSTIHEFRKGSAGGAVYHIVEHGGKWKNADLATPQLVDLETIATDNKPEPGAIATVRDKAFWTNGHGVEAGGTSRPALSSWDGTNVRYVGLDPFVSGTAPAVNFSADPAGDTVILYKRTFYVGLYNSATGHFSNGVLLGTITNPDPETNYVGDLSFSNLSSLVRTSHGATELGELYYVLYSTLDGGEVPYLIMNTTGSDVFKTQSGSETGIIIDDNAALGDANVIDVTKEMPTENYPPRAMSLLTYANGRVYYAPKASTSSRYKVASRDETSVGWSASADDLYDRQFLGVPEESYPFTNKKSLPNGEAPKLIQAASGNFGQVLVCTTSGTFLLEESLPGVHVWRTISWTEGILDKDSFVRTPYGDIWVTQNKEIVLLRPGDDQLIHISRDYASLLESFNLIAKADYLYDPKNNIDRYQVWDGSGKSVCHDFVLPGYGGPVPGEAYTTTNQAVTIARSLASTAVGGSPTGETIHVIAIGSRLYAQEGDPRFDKVVPTRDEEASGVYTEINGDYIGQWMDFGDHDIRKEFRRVYIVGDGSESVALGRSPVLFTWYGDLTATPAYVLEPMKAPQSISNHSYEAGVEDGHRFWYKFRIQLSGHGTEGSYYAWLDDGELSPSIYGAIHKLMLQISGASQNRQ